MLISFDLVFIQDGKRQELLDYFAVDLTERAGSVSLVGVDMHCGSELRADAADDVAENRGAGIVRDLNGHDLLVLDAELLSVSGGQVDMSLRDDDSLGNLDLALRTDYLTSGAPLDIAALAYGSLDAESSRVCEGDLDLCRRTRRTENDDIRDLLLRADESHALLARELTGLGEVLLMGESVSLAEEDFDVLIGEMDVSRGSFNKNLVIHFLKVLSDKLHG